jgi:hypothetical protein
MPRVAIALVAAAGAVGLAGCGPEERERAAAAVAMRFHAALERGDGAAACRELSEEAAGKVEQQEQRPCEDAILGLHLPEGGTAAKARVYLRSASVDLAQGGTTFLDESSRGWKVSAAGCDPTAPGQPYDCDLEG